MTNTTKRIHAYLASPRHTNARVTLSRDLSLFLSLSLSLSETPLASVIRCDKGINNANRDVPPKKNILTGNQHVMGDYRVDAWFDNCKMRVKRLTEETADEYNGVQSDENYSHIGPVKDVVLAQRHVVKDAFVVQVSFVVADFVSDDVPVAERSAMEMNEQLITLSHCFSTFSQ